MIAIAASIVIFIIDAIFHPSENWYRTEYYLSDGSTSGPEFGIGISTGSLLYDSLLTHDIESKKGLFSGMPLTANVSGPRNLTTQTRALANGFSNIKLSDPRSIRKGIESFILAKKRGNPKVIIDA